MAVFETEDRRLEFVASDFAEAAAFLSEGAPMIGFRLSPEAAARFAELTEASVGERLSFRVCGDLLAEAVVRDRIEGAGAAPTEGLGAATWYARVLRGEISC